MKELIDLYKKPWKTAQRSDGHWYIEDVNGHAIASITVSPHELREQAARFLLNNNEQANLHAQAALCGALFIIDTMNTYPVRGENLIHKELLKEKISSFILKYQSVKE